MMLIRPRIAALLVICAAILSNCARHGEDEIRTMLEKWFALGDQVYFNSEFRCTAAIYEVRSTYAKSALRLETEMMRALYALRTDGVMALALAGQSPDQVFISVMDADRSVGVPVQVAAVLSRKCMDADTQGAFHAALTNQKSLFVWVGVEKSLVIMDPTRKVVILASGVNW